MIGSFQESVPRKTAKNTVKHCNGGVGSIAANHCHGGKSSVVVTTLVSHSRGTIYNDQCEIRKSMPQVYDGVPNFTPICEVVGTAVLPVLQ